MCLNELNASAEGAQFVVLQNREGNFYQNSFQRYINNKQFKIKMLVQFDETRYIKSTS
jgi:hypothetical protein